MHISKNGKYRKFFLCFPLRKVILMMIFILMIIIFSIISCYWHSYCSKNIILPLNNWQEQVGLSFFNKIKQMRLEIVKYSLKKDKNNCKSLILMELGNKFVKKNNFIVAKKCLEEALSQTNEVNLQSLINLRLARLYLQDKNTYNALKTINKIKEAGWLALAENIRGDVYVIKGLYQEARASYQKVLQFNISLELQRLVLIKLNNLP